MIRQSIPSKDEYRSQTFGSCFTCKKQWISKGKPESKVSSLAAPCLQGLFLIKAWDSLSKARDHGEPLKDPRLCPLYSLLASELLPKEEPDCVPVESHPCTVSPGSLLLTISSNANLSVKPPCCRLPGNQGSLGCNHVLCSFLPCKW